MAKIKELPWNEQFAIAWAKMAPPARPSQTEQRFYEKIIKQVIKDNKNPRILILGSTPEFRDILLRNKVKPICCDINRDVFKSLTRIMRRRGVETFILSDWIKLKTKARFDLVLGHQVINMLSPVKQAVFFKQIYRHLKPGGLFITSVVIRANDRAISLLSGFKRYRKFKTINIRDAFSTIHPDLLLAISGHTGTYSPTQCLKIVDQLYRGSEISKKERDIYFKIMPSNDLKVYIPNQKSIEALIKKYLKILLIYHYPTKYYNSKHWPVYLLRKR
ncbi:MAG: class I SAM-dependent methyltransferase [Patescibacteria group bacterium]|nr:class I SAM-dependent methyltransferase [Patescibacteria group bacterium]MDD5121023.1 class I SAM-dependent methyltransferase [Patescibacteria group bacterium]MDD5221616.1 class I SAM-dependent methyltransferase [Patescibacteria group bacterium]MDD5396058.1 class I SAM-dependent methyltransferase [Patescibacteria group bacterium]